MDIASILGIIGGILLITIAIWENIQLFISPQSAMITFGGAFAATFINFPMAQVGKVLTVAAKAFFARPEDPYKKVELIVHLAEKARREGFLALEAELAQVEDPFLKRGVQSVIDGISHDALKDTMEKQMDFIDERHSMGQEIFVSIGTYCPSFGMAGTLIGLIIMLYNLDDPKKVGPGMALAIMTTLYGVLAAYLVFIPIAGKLKVRSDEERLLKEVVMEGILGLQAGDAPRFIRERLHAYLNPRLAGKAAKEAAAAAATEQNQPESEGEEEG
ncbi:MAG: motility protein A [Candidatus Omnitrophica bacterium]|nr:motility protein A [Candidatus Omnitrophota bacterium]